MITYKTLIVLSVIFVIEYGLIIREFIKLFKEDE